MSICVKQRFSSATLLVEAAKPSGIDLYLAMTQLGWKRYSLCAFEQRLEGASYEGPYSRGTSASMIRGFMLFVLFFEFSVALTVEGQSLQLAGKLLGAMNEANDALNTLDTLQTAASDALVGNRVSAGTGWSKLADRFNKAAADAESAPLPPDPVVTQPVSAAELADCKTRAGAVAKLTSYLNDLRSSRQATQESLRSLDHQLTRIAQGRRALEYLINVHEQLIKVPIYGDLFVLNWVDLNTSVSDSFGELESAFRAQRQKYFTNDRALGLRIGNLQSNISLFTPCVSSGTFVGTGPDAVYTWPADMAGCVQITRVRAITLSLTISPNGQLTSGGVTYVATGVVPTPGCWHYQFFPNPAPEAPHGLRLKSGTVSGQNINATFSTTLGSNVNPNFTGTIKNGRLSGVLNVPMAGFSIARQIQ
jgi:hypothetical protein